MDEGSTGSDSDYSSTWISWFLSSKGNEYFCEVDEDFILDRFNLTGLNNEVANYSQALDLITDSLDDDIQDELRGSLDVQARLLYGLIHARWVVTARGLAKMLEKYKRAEFGRCPRVLCASQPLLPVGLTDMPYEKSVKLYCGRCEDIYSPKSSRHGSIDGAYFGTTFPHLLFLVYPTLIPAKDVEIPGGLGAGSAASAGGGGAAGGPAQSNTLDARSRTSAAAASNTSSRRPSTLASQSIPGSNTSTLINPGLGGPGGMREDSEGIPAEGGGEHISTATVALKAERFRPRIYGFQVHEIARLQRWQEAVRDRQVAKLEAWEAQGQL